MRPPDPPAREADDLPRGHRVVANKCKRWVAEHVSDFCIAEQSFQGYLRLEGRLFLNWASHEGNNRKSIDRLYNFDTVSYILFSYRVAIAV